MDDPAANDPAARDAAIHKLKEDLARGTDPKTGEPYTPKEIKKKKNRLKLLEGRHHRIPGQKGTKGTKGAQPEPESKPAKPNQPSRPGEKPRPVKPGQVPAPGEKIKPGQKPKPAPKPPHQPRPSGNKSHPGDASFDPLDEDVALGESEEGWRELLLADATLTIEVDDEPVTGSVDGASDFEAEEDADDDDDGDDLTYCEWTALNEREKARKSFIGTLASESIDIVGAHGNAQASAYGAAFIRWGATTAIANSASAQARIGVTRTAVCDDPSPIIEFEATSSIRLVDTATSGGYASSAAVCIVAGDLDLTNQAAAVSGSAATSTTISLGPLSIQPFIASDGTVAPPDSIVPKREVKAQPDGLLISATSIAVKVDGTESGAEAEAQAEANLAGHIYVRCENCAASARVDF